ncbi:hypothetical protein AQUCO_04500154v1 [Aquilegia coerulea]|uniref:F-box domain-containing protein n=1 Tax=Aquilegia coerulea TaxID=218851 RepID=A0A2G5CM73_AQUCA|nr:hypothetical protein AQUCO_04500154v1 [Aquilegia coerulea]
MEKSNGDVVDGNSTSSSNTRDWKDLDRDVLISIYKRLCRKDLVKGAPLCCTSWYSASKDPCLWKVVNLRFWEPIKGSDDWWKETHPVNAILDFFVNRSQGLLTQIKFPLHSSVDDLLYVAERCPRLMYFDINIRQSKVVEEKKIFELSISKLKELEGMGVDEVFISDNSSLQQIQQCCPNFKHLKVYVHRDDDDSLSKNTVSLITTYLPKLKILDLSGTGIHREDVLVILKACHELESLDITRCGKICAKDEILNIGSRLKKFCYNKEVWDSCDMCEGECMEAGILEEIYRWPCHHVLEDGFEAYIRGTKEWFGNVYPESEGTFEELIINLYPDAGASLYPLFIPLFVGAGPSDVSNEYHEHWDCYCDCGFSSDSDDGNDAAYIEYCYEIE